MDLAIFTQPELSVAVRALKWVALAEGALGPAPRQLFSVLAELHGASVDADALEPMKPAEVALAIPDPHHKKRLVQFALVTALASGEVSPQKEARVSELAAALAIPERGLKVLHDLVQGSVLLTRFELARRFLPRFVGAAYAEEGVAGLRKLVEPILKGSEDPELAFRYKRLGLLPEGSFGRAYWEHCTSRGFVFPGERGGIPERMAFHDFGHVLSGYDTDPQGEIQQGAFQAGFVRNDGFVFLLFAIVHFHMGVQITPIAKPQRGLFDVPRVIRATARGAACKVDLSDHWTPWEVVARPLEEVRALYGIPA
jgi:hypothetical protein